MDILILIILRIYVPLSQQLLNSLSRGRYAIRAICFNSLLVLSLAQITLAQWVLELTSAPAFQLSSSRKFELLTHLLQLAGALLQHESGETV